MQHLILHQLSRLERAVSGVQAFTQTRCTKPICPKDFLFFTADIDQPEIVSHLTNHGIKELAVLLESINVYKYLGSFPSGTKLILWPGHR